MLTKTRTLPVGNQSDFSARVKLENEARKRNLRAVIDHLKEMIPFGGKHLVVAMEALAGSFIVDTLVVLDDVERLGKQIKLDELMGLVSELKEQSRCKVILIFNEDALGTENTAAYARYAEKWSIRSCSS
ncbi:hypothetical protein [Cupriavidus necator]|uniref:hypothetical protein n=1 Tax=Cupriavidus necator TaxID=106590 RepID=UPI000F4F68B3|nr:hypothetical protein [Cupriavidus necator]